MMSINLVNTGSVDGLSDNLRGRWGVGGWGVGGGGGGSLPPITIQGVMLYRVDFDLKGQFP